MPAVKPLTPRRSGVVGAVNRGSTTRCLWVERGAKKPGYIYINIKRVVRRPCPLHIIFIGSSPALLCDWLTHITLMSFFVLENTALLWCGTF